ncbi:MAG: hypothetical protein JKY13_03135, partial [Gammaproteobacteria bacterium]|nr:hypothetical protein [Gammaproteobacteria bacterium]
EQFDYCLNFANSGDSVIVNDDITLSDTYTLMGWFKTIASDSAKILLAAVDSTDDTKQAALIELAVDGTLHYIHRVPMGTGGGSEVGSTASYADNNWYHFAAVKNTSTGMTLYVDGSAQPIVLDITSINADVKFVIGKLSVNNDSKAFVGQLARFRVYDRDLSLQEIAQTMQSDRSGLVLHWPLDQTTGNQILDSSGNKEHATVIGTQVVADATFGSCLSFNGTLSDYVITYPLGNFPSHAITVSCWVKSTNTSKAGAPLSYNKIGDDNAVLLYDIRNLAPVILSTPYNTTIAFNGGIWHHISLTWRSGDGQTVLYKNGKQVSTAIKAQGLLLPDGGALILGHDQDAPGVVDDATQALEGQMAHVRIYDRALSPLSIQEMYHEDLSGLMLHLPFNSIINNTVVDHAPYSHVMTIAGTLSLSENDVLGNSIHFPGNTQDYISLPNLDDFPSQAVTMSCWLKSSATNAGTIFSYVTNTTVFIKTLVLTDLTNLSLSVNDTASTVSNVSCNDGAWHHIAVSWQNSDGKALFYKDGVLMHSATIGMGQILLAGGTLMIGEEQDSVGDELDVNEALEGELAHIRFHRRVLSVEEIRQQIRNDITGLLTHIDFGRVTTDSMIDSVADLSGNNNQAIVYGASEDQDERLGACLAFNGIDNYVQLANDTHDYTQGITVNAWVHYASFNEWSRLIDMGNGEVSDNITLGNQSIKGALFFDSYQQGLASRITQHHSLSPLEWIHVAITVDKTDNGCLYVNGTLIQNSAVAHPQRLRRLANYVGRSHRESDGYFFGKIANLQLYNRALSEKDIVNTIQTKFTGKVLDLPLDTLSGAANIIRDMSGSHCVGFITGSPTPVISDATFAHCIDFNGSTDSIILGDVSVAQRLVKRALTITVWVKMDLPNVKQGIVSVLQDSAGTKIGWYLGSNNNVFEFAVSTEGSGMTLTTITSASVNTNTWYHVTGVYDGNAMRLYVDGQLQTSSLLQSDDIYYPTTAEFVIGAYKDDTQTYYFNGKMTRLCLHNRELNEQDIIRTMNADKKNALTATSSYHHVHFKL